jgi:phage terminase large subunit-like protein
MDGDELFDFCNDVLGFTLEEKPHRELCHWIARQFPDLRFPPERPSIHAVLLWPRGTYKSTVLTHGVPLYILWKNHNAAGLITAHRHDVAKLRLGACKKTIERGEKFRELVGNWKPDFKEDKWSEEAFTITARTMNLIDPSLDTAAVGRPKDGSHPHFILADDVQSKENSATPVMRENVYQHIRDLYPLLQPGGTMIVIGTRKHTQDVYGKIFEINEELMAKNLPPLFSVDIRGCYVGETKELFFPGRLTEEFLLTQRIAMGDKDFACEYLNEPIAEGDKLFTRQGITKYAQSMELYVDALEGGGLIITKAGEQIPVNVSFVWDPAGHKPSDISDYHGITVCGCDVDNNWWIPAARQIKGTPHYVINQMIGMIVRYKPKTIGIETVFRQEMWLWLLRQRLELMDIECPAFIEIESKEAKYSRIEAIQPKVLEGGIIIDPACVNLIKQMVDYPEVAHDDLIDSLAAHLLVAHPPKPNNKKFVDNDDFFDDILNQSATSDSQLGLKGIAGLNSTRYGRQARQI